jgi:hypothetical protein
MSTASRLAKLAEGLDSNGVLSADKGGTGATSLAAVVTSATPAGVSDQANTSTGYFDLPSGTTAQRPGTANTGMVRYNSTLSIVETYNGTAWTGLGGSATVSTTAPQNSTDGAFWLNSETGDLNVYAGGAWVLIGGGGGGASTPAAVSDQANTSTGYFDLPTGTTAQRPGSATAGALRFNTETNYLEMYSGTAWVNLQYVGLMTATSSGATVTTSGNYKTLTYTSTGTFTLTDAPAGSSVEVLLVAGGGGGGTGYGGGGGAGGYYYNNALTISAGTYPVLIGAGGTNSVGSLAVGTSGSDTSFNSIAAIGGGGGGEYNATSVAKASNGGSGGGAGGSGTLSANIGTGTSGQGNNGGVAAGSSVSNAVGGGGGGAGAVGGAASGAIAGSGGVGVLNPISGSTTGQLVSSNYYISGGGGGGGFGTAAAGSGGSGGGGAGLVSSHNGWLPQSLNFSTWNYNNASQANTNSIAPDGSATATLMNATANSWDMYYPRGGLTVGTTYIFTVWVKLGTATNFAIAFNNSQAWDTITSNKTYTSADGLNTNTWTKISHPVVAPASGGLNLHILGHANSGQTQQTTGTIYLWAPTLTTTSFTQATSGTTNTGGGGGGAGDWSTSYGGNGGSGFAIIKYRFQ